MRAVRRLMAMHSFFLLLQVRKVEVRLMETSSKIMALYVRRVTVVEAGK